MGIVCVAMRSKSVGFAYIKWGEIMAFESYQFLIKAHKPD